MLARSISLLSSGLSYLSRNPMELLLQARAAAHLELAIPLDLARWGLSQLEGRKLPEDVQLDARAPALSLAATLSFMGNRLRVGAALTFDEVRASADELTLALRISDLSVTPLDGAEHGPVGMLLQSIDLTKPGNLVSFMPSRPKFLVEAKDDRVVLDLMRMGRFADNRALRRALGVLAPVLSVKGVRAEEDHLIIALSPHPMGVVGAVAALRA
jgi:hypothetical protein